MKNDQKTERGVCTGWRNTHGFVEPESGPSVLVHFSQILDMDGAHRMLTKGQRVSFIRETTEKGDRGLDVRVIAGGNR